MSMGEREQDFIERIVTLEAGQKQLTEDSMEMKSSLKELSSAVRQLTGFLTGSIDNMGQSVIFEIKTLGTELKRAILRLDAHEEKISDHGARIQVAESQIEDLGKKVAVLEARQVEELTSLVQKAAPPATAEKSEDDAKWGAIGAIFNNMPAILDTLKKWLPHLGWLLGGGALVNELAKHVKF